MPSPLSRAAFLPWVLALITALDFFDSVIFSFFASYIATGVGASLAQYVWLSSGYAVAAILGILQQEWWVERLGHRRYIAGCMLSYAAAGVFAALAGTPLELLIARSVQGYFIAPMMGACRIIIQTCFSAEERPNAIRAFLMLILLGSACAPLAGGILVGHFGWRALFACTVPVAVVFAGLALFALPDSGNRLPHERGATHFWPYILFAFAQAALQIVLMKMRFEPSSSPEAVLLAILSIAALVWFGYQQWRHPTPLLRLHALRERHFRAGLVLFLFYYYLSTGFSYLLPRMLEDGLGFTIVSTGNLIGLTGLVAAIVLFAYFRIAKLVKRKKFIIVAGFVLALIAAGWMTRIPPTASAAAVFGPLVLRGLLVLFMILPVASVTFNIFTNDEFTHGYRLRNIVRQMAISLATASILAFEQHRLARHQSVVVEHASSNNPMFEEALRSLFAAGTEAGWPAPEAHSLALAKLDPVIAQQAQLLALNDGFYFLAAVALCGGLFAAWQKQID